MALKKLLFLVGFFGLLTSYSSAQTCSSDDIAALKSCSNTTSTILNTIQANWPIPSPLPSLNNSIVNQLCSAYNTYVSSCLSSRNATCYNVSDVVALTSVVGYLCVDKNSVFSTQSDCVMNFITSPNAGLSNCISLAAEVQYHNLLTTSTDVCNAFKDATSCVYPLVQTQCGADLANALQEFSLRVAQSSYSDCQLFKCFNNTYCMYDETCRSGRTCQCATVCPQQNSPTCGSDSQVYGNECLFRKQECLKNSWMLERPSIYCNLYSANPTQCTDSVVDKFVHCALPLYNGMIASFRQLDTYLSNFNGNMINKTCAIYQNYVSCSATVPPSCAIPNGATLDELYKNYVCTNQGYLDLVNNNDCWQKVGSDFVFQQCSQDFGYDVDALPYYNLGSYVESFINDFGGMCTALHTLGTCVTPRVQALCSANALSVFNNVFQTYKMFMVNCNSACKSLVDSVYGIISSNNWPSANLDTATCTWHLQVPAGMNVNLLLRINKPFDCSPDNPTFISIYSGLEEDSSKLIATYCGQFEPDNVYNTPNGVNQMTVVYQKIMSNSVASPPFVAMFYGGTDACLSNPCTSGSTCLNTAGGYYCQCPAGYVGSLCNQYVGKCNLAVCKNGGTCVDTFTVTDLTMTNFDDPSQDFGYFCKCPSGFSGNTCKQPSSGVNEQADFQCPTNWVPFGQQCYFISPELIAEPDSETACANAGTNGLLSSIHSEAERSYIQQLMSTQSIAQVWLGARHNGGTFSWLDQSAWDFTDWTTNQPDLTLRCVVQSASDNYQWRTIDCFTSASYICKVSPPLSCDINPCLNGGTCVTTNGQGSCQCPPSFTGIVCGSLIGCSPNPCLNNGTCQSSNSGVISCACQPGYNGTICQVGNIACNSNPCQNGGRCVANGGGYRCSCIVGYSGTNCESIGNNCNSNPCLNGATCTNGVNSFQCACAAGFSGTTCSVNNNECSSSPCQNGGTCNDGINSYTCTCQSGYSGSQCQSASSTCASNPCSNGGTCTTTSAGFQCTCLTGFTGTTCQSTVNFCSSNPCQNGGTCQGLTNGYFCSCLLGFTGNNCQTSSTGNTCANNPCSNGATCYNGVSTYFCQCPSGFYGTQCSLSSGVCNSNPCSNGGSCIDLSGVYTCRCPTGFSGTQCQFSNTNVCSTNSPCLDGGSCSYSLGVTICTCTGNFQGPICQQTGTNQCLNFPCLNGGTCISGVNYYYCLCPTNYVGLNCQTVLSGSGSCSSNPCQNNGQCVPTTNGFTCTCISGWTGTLCNVASGMCTNNLCQNGATCQASPSTYTCLCPSGYTGYYCDNNVNSCLSNPCQNSGTCTNGVNSFTCQCISGFGGPTCAQVAGSMCNPNPCQNSASCVTLSNTEYLCRCPAGWIGANCEVDQNECLQIPCKNNGLCTNTAGSYYCTCQLGYYGSDCSQITNTCSSNPCSNGGTCSVLNGTSGYVCKCVPEYAGAQCTTALCQSGWKYNGGYCYTVISGTVTEPVAKNSCTNINAQLVSVHDVNERDFVATLMTANNLDRAWIGAEYSTSSSNYSWSDKSLWSYTSWGTSQPASSSTLLCTMQILQNGVTWQTRDCNGPEVAICKLNARIAGSSSSFPCSSNPCQNSGTCNTVGNTYQCMCPAGFGGVNCQSSATICANNPCFNGGTCKVVGNNYTCSCIGNYTVNSNCATLCPSSWSWYMGKCYLSMNTAATYDNAVNSCTSQQSKSRLLFVESQNEFYFAATLANKMSSNVWLGLVYETSSSQFRWTSSKYLASMDYTAWGFNQPLNESTNRCVQVVGFQGFTWETYDCTKTLKYICKWDGST